MNDIDFTNKKKVADIASWVRSTNEYEECTDKILLLNITDEVEFMIDRGLYKVKVYVSLADGRKVVDFKMDIEVYFDIRYFDTPKKVYLPSHPIETYIVGNTRTVKFTHKSIGGFVDTNDTTLYIEPCAFSDLCIANTPVVISILDINSGERMPLSKVYENCELEKIRAVYSSDEDTNGITDYINNGNILKCVNRLDLTLRITNLLQDMTPLNDLKKYDYVNSFRLAILFVPKSFFALKSGDYFNAVYEIVEKILALGLVANVLVTFIPGAGSNQLGSFMEEEKVKIREYFNKVSTENIKFDIYE